MAKSVWQVKKHVVSVGVTSEEGLILGPEPLEDIIVHGHPSLSVDQISDKAHNLGSVDINHLTLPADGLLPKSVLSLDIEEQFSLDALKPMNLDGPYLKENFTFPRFKDLKYYEPLLEVQLEYSILTVPSLGGLGIVSLVKDYKDKGYYLRSCAKIVGSGVMNKV